MMKDQLLDDARIEAMLNQMFLKEPQLMCPSSHRIMNLCINPDCKQSLACSQDDCKSCGVAVHPLCSLVPLRRVTHALNQRVNKSKDIVLKILQVDDELISAVRESKDRLKKFCFLFSDKQLQDITNQIYINKKIQCLNGAQAKKFYQRLLKKTNISERIAVSLERYTKSMQKIQQEIQNIKLQLFQSVVYQCNIDSAILKKDDKIAQQQLIYLKEALNFPKQMQLLFRASEHQFKASSFHAKCDNIPNTLTLVRTQFGKTIAGFTKYPWTSQGGTWLQQQSKDVFLLSLDLKQKMVPTHNKKLICKSSSYGPVFGLSNDSKSNDLVVQDQCHNKRCNYSIFPSSFNSGGALRYTQNQQTSTIFTGATNGHEYKIIEYQIFKVIY